MAWFHKGEAAFANWVLQCTGMGLNIRSAPLIAECPSARCLGLCTLILTNGSANGTLLRGLLLIGHESVKNQGLGKHHRRQTDCSLEARLTDDSSTITGSN